MLGNRAHWQSLILLLHHIVSEPWSQAPWKRLWDMIYVQVNYIGSIPKWDPVSGVSTIGGSDISQKIP